MAAEEKNKNHELRGKNEKNERKKEENHIKNGKKALKMQLFGL